MVLTLFIIMVRLQIIHIHNHADCPDKWAIIDNFTIHCHAQCFHKAYFYVLFWCEILALAISQVLLVNNSSSLWFGFQFWALVTRVDSLLSLLQFMRSMIKKIIKIKIKKKLCILAVWSANELLLEHVAFDSIHSMLTFLLGCDRHVSAFLWRSPYLWIGQWM